MNFNKQVRAVKIFPLYLCVKTPLLFVRSDIILDCLYAIRNRMPPDGELVACSPSTLRCVALSRSEIGHRQLAGNGQPSRAIFKYITD